MKATYYVIAWIILGLLSGKAAEASPVLLAEASIAGNTTDLSGLTNTLENGVPANLLGGFGSGLAYAGGNTFVAVPDRGPNAVSYNPLVDDTVSYIDRLQTFNLTLTPATSGSLPYNVTPVLTGTTLLSSAIPLTYGTGVLGTGTVSGTSYTLGSGVPALNATNHAYYFTGRSDGFSASTSSLNANDARLDPESIRVSNDGKNVFVSDEYGPFIYEFDRSTGQRVKTYTLPSYYGVTNLSSQGNVEISGNTQGRLANKGMEGLAITPDGKTLVGVIQSPLIQDGGANSNHIRIVTVDVASGAVTGEYVYTLSSSKDTVSDIVAVNDHQFLIDERDGNSGTGAKTKQLFLIDLTGATNVMGNATLPLIFAAVGKGASPFLDLLDPTYGLNNANFPQKIEGVAFGPSALVNGVEETTLWITNDNDFDTTEPNDFFVFGVSSADLSTYQAQEFVPEPASIAFAAAGLLLLGCAIHFKRSQER